MRFHPFVIWRFSAGSVNGVKLRKSAQAPRISWRMYQRMLGNVRIDHILTDVYEGYKEIKCISLIARGVKLRRVCHIIHMYIFLLIESHHVSFSWMWPQNRHCDVPMKCPLNNLEGIIIWVTETTPSTQAEFYHSFLTNGGNDCILLSRFWPHKSLRYNRVVDKSLFIRGTQWLLHHHIKNSCPVD